MAPSTGPVAACYPPQQVIQPPVYKPACTSEHFILYVNKPQWGLDLDLDCVLFNICEIEKLLSLKL